MILALLLAGCGARGALVIGGGEAGSTGAGGSSGAGGSPGTGGAGGGGPAPNGWIGATCAPADGPAIALHVDGHGTCTPSPTLLSGVWFYLWGPDLTGLQSGAVFTISPDTNAPGQGVRVVVMGTQSVATTVVGGTVTFTSVVQNASATGTFDVTLMDGTAAQGSFDAVWCPGGATCG